MYRSFNPSWDSTEIKKEQTLSLNHQEELFQPFLRFYGSPNSKTSSGKPGTFQPFLRFYLEILLCRSAWGPPRQTSPVSTLLEILHESEICLKNTIGTWVGFNPSWDSTCYFRRRRSIRQFIDGFNPSWDSTHVCTYGQCILEELYRVSTLLEILHICVHGFRNSEMPDGVSTLLEILLKISEDYHGGDELTFCFNPSWDSTLHLSSASARPRWRLVSTLLEILHSTDTWN